MGSILHSFFIQMGAIHQDPLPALLTKESDLMSNPSDGDTKFGPVCYRCTR